MTKYILFVVTLLLIICLSTTAQNYAPEQVRLQYDGVEGQYSITYTTGSSSNSDYKKQYLDIPQSHVYFGDSPNTLTQVANGTSHRFTFNKYQADIHQVILTKLVSGNRYYYKVGDPSKPEGVSEVFHFTAGFPRTWAMFGDYGMINIEQAYEELVKQAQLGKEFGAVFHLGDIAYDLHHQNGEKGDRFMRALEPISAYYPYMFAVGNHESHGNFTHYENRYIAQMQLGYNSGSDTLFWYSWNEPNVHYFVFDTEVYKYHSDPAKIARQLEWLERDLKEYNTPANRKKYPWIIALGHKCDWQDETKFDDFRPMFHKYGVDMLICGHQHNYQRLYPGMRHNVQHYEDSSRIVNPKYWMQIVVGSPGCQEKISTGQAPYRDGVIAHILAYGYGLLTVHNATHVEWNWKQTNAPASSQNGETLFDQAVLAMTPNDGKIEIKDHMFLIQEHHGMRDWD